MKPMEAKTETSLTGSRLPGREKNKRERKKEKEREREKEGRKVPLWPADCAELPGSPMSTCLPFLSVSFFALIPPFPSFFFLLLRLLLLLSPLPPSSRLTRGFAQLLQESPPRELFATIFILGPCTAHRYAKRNRFTQIRPRTPSWSNDDAGAPVPNLFPR